MPVRAIVIVLDSVGIGEMPDAADYGDKGSNTLGNIARQRGKLNLPHLQALGLGNIAPIQGVEPVSNPKANFGKMAESSRGKDTTTGHWEIAGIILEKAFPVFPEGFPRELIKRFEGAIGRQTLGNVVASGTEIIKILGEEHMRTGRPIVYTSADSVFQIAAHEEVIPLEELMRICRMARELLTGDLQVGRVIARPFLGAPGSFYRTPNRHDYALDPPGKTLLDCVQDAGQKVLAVGKIKDIYAGRGVTEYVLTQNNMDGVDKTLAYMARKEPGLIMTNLVDFDMLYGHRNDVAGYARALADFDARLPEIMAALSKEDLLVITADHGCDPTTASTDHSREYVPVLLYGQDFQAGADLGVRTSFADLGATITDFLQTEKLPHGLSFYQEIKGGAR